MMNYCIKVYDCKGVEYEFLFGTTDNGKVSVCMAIEHCSEDYAEFDTEYDALNWAEEEVLRREVA